MERETSKDLRRPPDLTHTIDHGAAVGPSPRLAAAAQI
jgi:hypothetical protein